MGNPCGNIINFGEHPVKMECPKCSKEITTQIKCEIGSLTWTLVVLLFLLCMWP